jgi:zinc protease
VIVGNVDGSRIERLVRGTLGTLPAGQLSVDAPGAVTRSRVLRGGVAKSPHQLHPRLLQRAVGASPDYPAMRIATAVLSGRMFAEIRIAAEPHLRRGRALSRARPSRRGAVRDHRLARPHPRPHAGRDRRPPRDQIDPAALERLVQQFITDYFLDNETNSDQANFLARAELYQGDYRKADAFVDDLRA